MHSSILTRMHNVICFMFNIILLPGDRLKSWEKSLWFYRPRFRVDARQRRGFAEICIKGGKKKII